MVTRATDEMYALIKKRFPEAAYDPVSRLLTCGRSPQQFSGTVAVTCTGTSDLPIAEGAAGTAAWMGDWWNAFMMWV